MTGGKKLVPSSPPQIQPNVENSIRSLSGCCLRDDCRLIAIGIAVQSDLPPESGSFTLPETPEARSPEFDAAGVAFWI